LPGSPEAVRDAFEILSPILPHALELIRGRVKDRKETRKHKHFPQNALHLSV
jgi:hypothetical protein